MCRQMVGAQLGGEAVISKPVPESAEVDSSQCGVFSIVLLQLFVSCLHVNLCGKLRINTCWHADG
jgi:hypothetical protein